jgi:two-component system CheB/CheR fusion protein
VTKKRKSAAPRKPDPTTARLMSELEVHRAELEVQNEELRTARQATEAALERYTEVFDFAPIGYATLDHRGAIREINHAGGELLGSERARLVGKRFAAFVAPAMLRAFDALLATARHQPGPARCELELARGETSLAIRVTAAALHRKQTIVMLAFEDISAGKAKEAELAATAQALARANERKDEFLAMLSHELRNPLSPIRTSVAVLQLAPSGSEPARAAVDIIDRAASHLTRLVDDLLDVTRITRGKIELHRARLDLAELVQRTVADHALSFAQRRIDLVTRLDATELWVDGDPARLVQVLSNVVGNAERFTLPGGRVVVIVERCDDAVVVRVRDTGIGIAPEVIGQLFEPFAQAPQGLDRNRGGLGLGLAMVKALVELHGGTAAIHSEGLGRGTELTISLPAAPPPTIALATQPVPDARPRRILVIEDMIDTASSLVTALSLRGHVVEVAFGGKQGLEVAAAFHPEVVLCDLGLPDIDGFAIARIFRTDDALRGAYLVALSGYARAEDVERAREAGFACHLAKPARIDQLELVLASAPHP